MLFTETVTSSTFELLKCLMRDAALKDFVLVGESLWLYNWGIV